MSDEANKDNGESTETPTTKKDKDKKKKAKKSDSTTPDTSDTSKEAMEVVEMADRETLMAILASFTDVSAETWSTDIRSLVALYIKYETQMSNMLEELSLEYKAKEWTEKQLREVNGTHEDEHSHPQLFTASTEARQQSMIVRGFVMAYIKDREWFTQQTRLRCEIRDEWANHETCTKNIQPRLKLLLQALPPLYERVNGMTARVEKLQQSKSTDAALVATLLGQCNAALEKEEEDKRVAEQGPSWDVDQDDVSRTLLLKRGPFSSPSASTGADIRSPSLPFGLPTGVQPALSFPRTTAGAQGDHVGSGRAGVPSTALMSTFQLKQIDTLEPGEVKMFVSGSAQLAPDLEPASIQRWMTPRFMRSADICALTDPDFTHWRVMNKEQIVALLEEKVLKGQKDKWVKSMDELFSLDTIKVDPHNLTAQGMAMALDALFEKMGRFEVQIALAEGSIQSWKALNQLLLKLWEQGHLRKGGNPAAWNNDAGSTTELRLDVAVTIRARCNLSRNDPLCITTAMGLMIEIIKEVILRAEAFQSRRKVYVEMARNYNTDWKQDHTSKKPRPDNTAPTGGGAQGAPKGGQKGPTGPRVDCPCGKTHAMPCRNNGIPPASNFKQSLGMQLNKHDSKPSQKAAIRTLTVDELMSALDPKTRAEVNRQMHAKPAAGCGGQASGGHKTTKKSKFDPSTYTEKH